MTQDISKADEFAFKVMCSVFYHEDRARFFHAADRVASFLTVALGSAAFAEAIKTTPTFNTNISAWFSAIIGIVGLLNLSFDLSGRANIHNLLKSKFYGILANSVIHNGIPTKRDEAALFQLYADEPSTMWAVNLIAFNRAVEHLGRPIEIKCEIDPWRRYMRHIFSMPELETMLKKKVDQN